MEVQLLLDDTPDPLNFTGPNNENLKYLEHLFDIKIFHRANNFTLRGKEENIEKASEILKSLNSLTATKKNINKDDIKELLQITENKQKEDFKLTSSIKVSSNKFVKLKTYNHKNYFKSIVKNDITFGIGPAGTGKTYLAVATALNYLLNKKIKKIILTRPIVEAGENLGFLPGNLEDKINPYLRPLLDSIYDMANYDEITNFKSRGQIEVAPLAYMRGRTLNNAFVILDEAQNTTIPQMKMFLTRLGHNSKVVITGDITQKDLPKNQKSGMDLILKILKGIHGINFVSFDKGDVVRHPIVIKIIEAFEKYEKKK